MTEQASVGGALEAHPAAFANSIQAIPTSPFPALLASSVSPIHYTIESITNPRTLQFNQSLPINCIEKNWVNFLSHKTEQNSHKTKSHLGSIGIGDRFGRADPSPSQPGEVLTERGRERRGLRRITGVVRRHTNGHATPR